VVHRIGDGHVNSGLHERSFRRSGSSVGPAWADGIGGGADAVAVNYRCAAAAGCLTMMRMTAVLAALDNSLAVNPVLVMARALARVLGARVEAIHVVGEGAEAAEKATIAAGVPLRLGQGPVVERLVEAGRVDDVVAMVIGARGTIGSDHVLGSTSLAVVTSLETPVVVVPPAAEVAPRIRRVLVPLEGTMSSSLAPRSIIELAGGSEVEVVVLHVDGPDDDDERWTRQFLARFCPWGLGNVRMERRAGRRDDVLPLVADELQADLIVLGWAQQLSHGRAPVVRATLERSKIPVMLIPVSVEGEPNERA
jgi:nucleotide-binding universal stress UspA family protein